MQYHLEGNLRIDHDSFAAAPAPCCLDAGGSSSPRPIVALSSDMSDMLHVTASMTCPLCGRPVAPAPDSTWACRVVPRPGAVTTGPLVFATGDPSRHSPEMRSCTRCRTRRGHDRTDDHNQRHRTGDASGPPTDLLAPGPPAARRRHHGRTRPRGDEWARARHARAPRRAMGSLLPRPAREHPRAIHARNIVWVVATHTCSTSTSTAAMIRRRRAWLRGRFTYVLYR